MSVLVIHTDAAAHPLDTQKNVMLTYSSKLNGFLRNHQAVYSFICIGIVSSLIFWPLLNTIFCGLLLVYWIASPHKTLSFRSISVKKAALFAALYLPVVVGCLYSADLAEASFRLQQKSALLIFPLVFGSLPTVSAFFKKRIFWTLLFSTVVGCIICLANGFYEYIITGQADRLYGYPLVILKDMHPSILGLCCLLSLAFIFGELGDTTNRRARIYYGALIFFFIGFLYLVGNRNNLICLNLVSFFYIFKIAKKNIHKALGIASLLAIAVMAFTAIPPLRERFCQAFFPAPAYNSPTQDPRTLPDGKNARLAIWSSGWDIIKNNWIIGVGTGDAQAALQNSFIKKNQVFAFYNNCNAHNQYLQEAIAFGIPGLLIFLACLMFPCAYVFYSRDNSLYFIFLLLFALVCLSESVLQLNKGIIWYSFFNSLFAFAIPTEKESQ